MNYFCVPDMVGGDYVKVHNRTIFTRHIGVPNCNFHDFIYFIDGYFHTRHLKGILTMKIKNLPFNVFDRSAKVDM